MNRRIVEVAPYNSQWAEEYLQESERLKVLFPSETITFFHIGSTSVPGLSAKPIIDILGEVTDLQLVEELTPILEKAGYEAKGENGIPERRYFVRIVDEVRKSHVHIFQENHPDLHRHLVFRDYLREHPAEAKRYGDLKERAAEEHRYNIEAYIQEKDPLIKELERKALEWANIKNS